MAGESARRRTARSGEAGFALLVVLWTLVLITLLVAAIGAAGQSEARITTRLRDAEVAREAVDGAVQEAIFRVAAGQWSTGPLVRRLQVGTVMTKSGWRTMPAR
jgi:Tfp pilus assembly protein PilX